MCKTAIQVNNVNKIKILLNVDTPNSKSGCNVEIQIKEKAEVQDMLEKE